MSVELIRELYDYHRWANRRLFDVAAGLGGASTKGMARNGAFRRSRGCSLTCARRTSSGCRVGRAPRRLAC
jgi:uncharacterized damage-inducible protein DinB